MSFQLPVVFEECEADAEVAAEDGLAAGIIGALCNLPADLETMGSIAAIMRKSARKPKAEE